jgi:hypothetical protein
LDDDTRLQLFRAFMLGARTLVACEGKQLSSEQRVQLLSYLRDVAGGEATLCDLSEDQMQYAAIANLIAGNLGKVVVAADRQLAGEILRCWK